MIRLNLKGENEGTMIVTDKINALSRIIECMQRNEVREITVEYANNEKVLSTSEYVERMKNDYLPK